MTTARRRAARPSPSSVGAVVAIGLSFGFAVRLGDAGPGPVPWVVNIGGPWVLLAFAVGWQSPAAPAASAIACLVMAVLAKYGLQLAQGDIGVRPVIIRVCGWSAVSGLLGLTIGSAGRYARNGASSAWALVSGLLAAEAALFLSRSVGGESAQLRYHGQAAGTAVFVVELAAAALFAAVASGVVRKPAAAE